MADRSAPLPSEESIGFLEKNVIPALTVAQAGLAGIGVPGLEPVVNGVCLVATMISTMKNNRKDLEELKRSLDQLANINISGTSGDMDNRIVELTSKFTAMATKCKAIGQRSILDRLFRSQLYKERILEIRQRLAEEIREFTFHGNISIEILVRQMMSKVGAVDQKIDHAFTNDVLAKLKFSAARYDADNTPEQCMDGTRVDMISQLLQRLTVPPNPDERVVILSGSAGSGKSTIAKSMSALLADRNILAASFFFSRDFPDRNNPRFLPSTLARQLADYNSEFRALLVKLLDEDRTGVLSADPRVQFEKLVVRLLAQIRPLETPWIICLDALDECGADRGQICLRWLSDSIAQLPIHIRFFLTGRPNVPLCLKFDSLRFLAEEIILDDIDVAQVQQDIHLYVENSLDGSNWITRDSWKAHASDVDEITTRADGLFIFAATAVRYVLAALPQDHPQRILGTIIQLMEPLKPRSLAALLEMNVEELRRTLLPLSAVLRIPDTVDGGAIRIIHLSFREFITGNIQDVRPDLLCGTEAQQHEIMPNIFRILHGELKFNICDLPTSHVRNVDVPDINRRIQRYIPDHIQYASRFWADHLTVITPNNEIVLAAEKFLLNQFLFWLEILSLLGCVGYGQHALSKFMSWAPKETPAIYFAKDSKRFITLFADAIIQSAPHIYLSALALAPTQSEITKRFRSQFSFLTSIRRGQMTRWPAMLGVLDHSVGAALGVFSPDGKGILSGSDHSTMRLWDEESGEALGDPLQVATHSINSVAFSPDGKRIVSGSHDRSVHLWDADSGQALCDPFEGHTDTIYSVAFSPDGTQIVSGSDDKSLCLWNADTGEAVMDPFKGHTDTVYSVAFSPDGCYIVSGSKDNTLQLWDVAGRGRVGGPWEGHTHPVTSVAFSPDGKRILSGSHDNTIRLWNLETAQTLGGPLQGHTDTVYSVAFSPDGKQIASGSKDCNVRIWDAQTGKALGEPFEGHTDWVRSVVFSPNGKWVVSGSNDRTVRRWDARGSQVDIFQGHTDWVNSVAFSPDGKQIVSASRDGTVCLWDADREEVHSLLIQADSPSGFSSDGEPVEGSLPTFQHNDPPDIPEEGHLDYVRAVAFSPDGKCIVSGSDDKTLRRWDAENGEPVGTSLKGHTDYVSSVAFSPDGKRIASGSKDCSVRIWDAETGEALSEPFQGHTDWVRCVAFSPNGRFVVSGSVDKSVRIWDASTGKVVGKPFQGHTDWVNSVSFSPDGQKILSGSHDGRVRLWSVESGEALGKPLEGHTSWVTCVAFSPDGQYILSGSCDKSIRLWDAALSQPLSPAFEGHTDNVRCVAFSSDGKWIASGADDQTVRLWDAQTKEAVGVPFEGHTDYVRSVAFSPDGKTIVSGADDNTVYLWSTENLEGLGDLCHSNGMDSAFKTGSDSVIRNNWRLQAGWICSRFSELLLWLPSPNRFGLWTPHTKVVIGKQQTLISFQNCVHGRNWKDCYTPRDRMDVRKRDGQPNHHDVHWATDS
ncbi:quinon protein alcohol dehydrogenase-like superfamily [Mycena crocata]|nr:quinon protein alcohol dehydrogenase-like superfamily [Mycena crocata]